VHRRRVGGVVALDRQRRTTDSATVARFSINIPALAAGVVPGN
jgi:hypothetical protein